MKTLAQVVIGYMYKVLKNGKDDNRFRAEFAAIRHGDYNDFLNLIGKPIAFVVSYNVGLINTDVTIREDDVDFGRLLKSGESLKEFYKLCYNEYGQITDDDLPDEVFEHLALFELSLRMHRNNLSVMTGRKTLEEIINELQVLKGLTNEEIEILHKGRKVLNNVKRPEKMKGVWSTAMEDIMRAFIVLRQYQMTII